MDSANSQLALAPLGAGDLIDRAVRLYRRHFLTLIRIAAPPVLVSAIGSTITTITFREFTATSSEMRLALFMLLWLAGVLIIGCGSLFSIIVMGGATRNLVAHLLWNEPVSMRTTYRAVKSRFWGLLGGSLLMASWLGLAASVAFMAWFMIFYFVALASVVLTKLSNWLAVTMGVLGGMVATIVALTLFFFVAGRGAYGAEAMLVEGKTGFSAVGRSVSLASGNVNGLLALALFTFLLSYLPCAVL